MLPWDVDNGHSLDVGDVDGDGHQDIAVFEMRLQDTNPDAKMWLFMGDGAGGFTRRELQTGVEHHEAKLGDLDDDGDLDILTKPWDWDVPRVDIWLQNGSVPNPALPLDQWQRHVIDAAKPELRSVFVIPADLSGDGLPDVATGAWWYENPGPPDAPWTRHEFGSPLNNLAALYDFDDDGDLDALGTQGIGSAPNADFAWAQNQGDGTFDVFTNVESGVGDYLQGAAAGRLSGGVLEVVLSWATGPGLQALTVPADPTVSDWTWRQLSPTTFGQEVTIADLDDDGDDDLVLGPTWLRNDGGAWTPVVIEVPAFPPDRNRVADINGDGLLDVVVGFHQPGAPLPLSWYEQTPSGAWMEHVIDLLVEPMSLDLGDIDLDGDIDVVVGEHNLADPAAARLFVYENDGDGITWVPHLVHTGDEHHDGAQLIDTDKDGDLDIVSIGWEHDDVLVYENLAIDIPDNQAPQAVAGAVPTTGPVPLTVAFDGTASNDPDGTIVSYEWDFGDGGTGTGPSPSHEYTATGTYLVTLRVTDNRGVRDSTTLSIDVSEPLNEAPSITSAPVVSVAENQTEAIDVEASDPEGETEGAGLTYSLTTTTGGFDNGLFDLDPANGVVTFKSAPDFEVPGDDGGDNVYDIEVTVTDTGLLTDTQTIAITVTDVNEPPAKPTGLAAIPGDNQVSLDWDDNSEADLDYYTVYRSLTSGGPQTDLTPSGLATSDYVDTTAVNGTTYWYVVTATDTGNDESVGSDEVSATPAGVDANAPTVEAGLQLSVPAGSANGAEIGRVIAVDDTGVVAFAVTGGNGSGIFAIDNTGLVTLADATQLDFASTPSYSLLVAATDASGNTSLPSEVKIIEEGAGWLRLSSQAGDIPAPPNNTAQASLLVLDIDRDGDNDFTFAARSPAPALVWYRRTGTNWEIYLIES